MPITAAALALLAALLLAALLPVLWRRWCCQLPTIDTTGESL